MTKSEQKIPERWSVKKLGELGCFSKGSGITKNDLISEGIPCVRYAELYTKYNFVIPKCVSFISEDTAKTAKQVQLGDILFAGSGETKEEIGKCAAYVNKTPAYAGGDNIIFRPHQDNSIFLSYFLNTIGRCYLNRFGQGDSIVHIHAENLKKICILLPPLSEQEKIAEILSCWDDGIEKLSALIEKKKIQKKALMQQLLTGKTRLPGFIQPWKDVKLGKIGTTYTGLSGKNKDDFGRGAYFIPYMNIYQNNKIDPKQLELVDISDDENQNTAQYGDIFFTTSSETPEEVGFASVLLFKPEQKIYLNSFCFGYRLNDFNTLLPDYAAYMFRSNQIRKTMFKLAQGATRFNLSKNTLMKERILLPSDIAEQKAIAEILSKADEEIELLNKKLEAFKQEKKALMQQLLTGKIRVKVN